MSVACVSSGVVTYYSPVMRRLFSLFLLTIAAACGTAAPPKAPAVSSADSGREAWLDALARGYFPGRSGQIFIVPREGDFIVDRDPLYAFMHGSPWPYDTHVPLLFAGTPWAARSVPPEHGQHTEEVLLELGYDWDRIGALRDDGIV